MKANIPAHVVDLKKAESYGTWSSINCMMLDRRATVATFYIEVAGADEATKDKMAIFRKLSMKLKEKGIVPKSEFTEHRLPCRRRGSPEKTTLSIIAVPIHQLLLRARTPCPPIQRTHQLPCWFGFLETNVFFNPHDGRRLCVTRGVYNDNACVHDDNRLLDVPCDDLDGGDASYPAQDTCDTLRSGCPRIACRSRWLNTSCGMQHCRMSGGTHLPRHDKVMNPFAAMRRDSLPTNERGAVFKLRERKPWGSGLTKPRHHANTPNSCCKM